MNREQTLKKLKKEKFDLLIIGGGATGAGIALDATSRGLKVALVEKNDFASGTSSKSTKLIHGGVRYLEIAVKQLDRGQLSLVKEALHERAILLKIAPHLTRVLSIVTPLYHWYEIPYYRMGLKMYDFLAGSSNLFPSRGVSAKEILSSFPDLKAQSLRGGVLYADGQFDDTRMNVSILLTAACQGATALNYIQVQGLLKSNQKICGARVYDQMSSEEFEIQAKGVINATGPFVDTIRKMDDASAEPLLSTSSGIHLILDKKYCPSELGLLFPKTEDGRVLFMLPWLGYTLVGTTDNPASLQDNPHASEEDVSYLLAHIQKYLQISIKREEVLSTWSGLRPLVSNSHASSTSQLSRDHIIQISSSNLLTITGGKWTTYRKMALDAINEAVRIYDLQPLNTSRTESIKLIGAENYHQKLNEELKQKYKLDADVASYLAQAYGDQAEQIIALAKNGKVNRLIENYPYLEEEVIYAVNKEMAIRAIDFLARRTRLSFLDIHAAKKALPKVLNLMAASLSWSESRKEEEKTIALQYMKGNG